MKQVLEEDDNGVLVYVAPTKALVNQIAAEVQARFSKSFKHGAKSVWAIHTRDYRINNPTGCQVLVTVPHMLQIMLLAPGNARAWSSRVKRIIFDEIHCIGQAEDGVVWEQLLLLAPCPIIALSATVGNPRKFSAWLSRTQETNGIRLEMIEHRHRYSDLRKYVYNPPQNFLFNGFSVRSQLPSVGLDNAVGITFMHPVASLVDRSRGMPDDLSLEPRDCWMLWNAMKKHQTEAFLVDELLDPSNCLPRIVRKADVIEWEAKLKALLKTWIENHKSPFEMVLRELEHPVTSALRPELQISSGKLKESESPCSVEDANSLNTTLPLICSLHDQGALPALFFNYDRSSCELLCRHLLSEFQGAEARWKESSQAWKTQLNNWEHWKQSQERQARKKAPKKTKRGKADDEATTRTERMRDAGSEESSPYKSFNPDDPVNGFHLADTQKLTPSELQQYADELKVRLVPDWLINALKRGIGVHHAGLNRKYRQVCEILFRKGYLRVVIATGTLALGINMPCKTVVFSGDSIFLTALNFRQAAGRAGRRGFDVLGNVVFQGVPYSKVCRLLSSRLPDLNGHFPITTSLVLRLFILLHESKHAAYAVKAINSILSCPRIYLGGPESKHTVLHHLRFSIEYLRRNHLLDALGAPLNFAGCVSHLYYTGNAGFAFHALLKSGYFSKHCADIHSRPKQVLLTLMLVMSHLFGRQYLRQSVLESHRAAMRWSSSVVILPPLPQAAASIMKAHNDQTLDIYAAYVSTFIDQHVKETDHNLPLTGMKCGGDKSLKQIGLLVSALPPVRINSAFVALSGHRDEWESVSDLCKMVRSGVWLEEAVVPYVGTYPGDGTTLLNAYLYDFFKHGNVLALEKENGIRRGDIWFVLNDFSLVLATVVTSLENFLKLSLTTGTEMLDVMGSGDMRESEVDERVLETESANECTISSSMLPIHEKTEQGSTSSKAPSALRRKKLADSWDDEVSDDMAENDGGIPETIGEALKAAKAEKKRFGKGMKQTKEVEDDGEALELGDGELLMVLKAFTMLQAEFNQKFKAMWA
jgi:ATP-dependent RNA helicase DDX60